MRVFADTSGLYAALIATDKNHSAAITFLRHRNPRAPDLWTSSYVLLEFVSLLQARVGLTAVREWRTSFEPILRVLWVDAHCYQQAMESLVQVNGRQVSLTDWTSFVLMRQNRLSCAFTFDAHFADQGFTTVPD